MCTLKDITNCRTNTQTHTETDRIIRTTKVVGNDTTAIACDYDDLRFCCDE